MIGYLSLLHDEPEISPTLRKKYAGIALEKSLRLEDLINELFDITQFNMQTMELQQSRLNLSLMLEQLAEDLQPLTWEKEQTIALNLVPIVTLGDSDKLAHVFGNLLKNALSYGVFASEITITSLIVADEIHISFCNQGMPIPPEDLERIF